MDILDPAFGNYYTDGGEDRRDQDPSRAFSKELGQACIPGIGDQDYSGNGQNDTNGLYAVKTFSQEADSKYGYKYWVRLERKEIVVGFSAS